jgi:hypothetical protein
MNIILRIKKFSPAPVLSSSRIQTLFSQTPSICLSLRIINQIPNWSRITSRPTTVLLIFTVLDSRRKYKGLEMNGSKNFQRNNCCSLLWMSRKLRIFVTEICSNRNVLVPKGTLFTRADILLLILPPLTMGGASKHFLKCHALKRFVPCYYVVVNCR